jgi:hypothetical protein
MKTIGLAGFRVYRTKMQLSLFRGQYCMRPKKNYQRKYCNCIIPEKPSDQCTENLKQLLPEPIPTFMFLCVRDLYIPTVGLPILLQENRWTDSGNIKIAHRYMNVEIVTESVQFHSWDYINPIFFAVWVFSILKWKLLVWQALEFIAQRGSYILLRVLCLCLSTTPAISCSPVSTTVQQYHCFF